MCKKIMISFVVLLKNNITFYLKSSSIVSLILVLICAESSICYAQDIPWTQKADMNNVRQGHSSGVIDGKIYVIGGVQYNSGTVHFNAIKSMEIYDPDLGTWTAKADMNTGRVQFPSCVIDGKIWAIGGGQSVYWDPLNTIEVYDPDSNVWKPKTNMPRVRMGHTASLVNGKIYVIGGADSNDLIPLVEVDVYDLMTDNWTTVKNLPTPRMNLQAVVLNGIIYTIGGHRGNAGGELGVKTVESYDPATDTWATKADMIYPRKYFFSCILDFNIYAFGGVSGNCESALSSVEAYDPVKNIWTARADIPNVWVMTAAASLNGKAYVSGGTIQICPPSVRKTVRVYNLDHDFLRLIDSIAVNKTYAKTATDTVCVAAKISDPKGITLLAEIEAPDETSVDSLQLFDDGNHNDGDAGDSLFANVWPVSSAEERSYYVDLQVTRIDTDTVINHLDNITGFTTIGPVVYEDYLIASSDTIPNPGNLIKIKITLKNNGTTAPATNIKAELLCLESWVNITGASRTFDDIAAGEKVQGKYTFNLNILEDCPGDVEIPFELKIASGDYTFWRDTFYVYSYPSAIEEEKEIIPKTFSLNQNYPNPFNPSTMISYQLPKTTKVELSIYNILGQKVVTLISEKQQIGYYQVEWDATGFASGIYYFTLKAGDFHQVKKLVLLR
jgi:N-acetylneuraminic acid mutarotase